jgi:hypothetical protein
MWVRTRISLRLLKKHLNLNQLVRLPESERQLTRIKPHGNRSDQICSQLGACRGHSQNGSR